MLTAGRLDLSGEQVGRLVVTTRWRRCKNKRREIQWLCHCSCGRKTWVFTVNLRRLHTLSCGCFLADLTAKRSTTHGHTRGRTKSPEYRSWRAMIQRCTNPTNNRYSNYGGRGITVCPRWRDSFEHFLSDMGLRPNGQTLDRLNSDGNYEPGNCRWATASEQNRNRRPRRRKQAA